MNLIDKILLGILVILLPVGIWMSYTLFSNQSSQAEDVGVDVVKLKEMVDRFSQMELSARPNPPKQMVISSVTYASESGNLKIEGTAPSNNMSVMMSATVLPPQTSETSDETLGSQIEHYAVPTSQNGKFSVDLPLGKKSTGMVEIRLEQEDVVRTIRFDLENHRQLL